MKVSALPGNRRGQWGVMGFLYVCAGALIISCVAAVQTTKAFDAHSADLTGFPRVVDGDTVAIGSTRIRLEGIDAPETDQICLNGNGDRWTCGIEARDQLIAHVAGREINCTASGIDAYKRTLGTCKLAGEDLNGWMVQQGWALSYTKYSSVYRRAEDDAKTHQRGLWRGAFIAPWDWRHRNNKTEILGAYSVPINAQSLLIPRSGIADAPSPDCVIKGNINRDGERIYHVPGQQYYDRNSNGSRWRPALVLHARRS